MTGVKHPMEAISTLRMSRGLFDLIVTDYHMPVMNGIELQQRVHEEFGLPVISEFTVTLNQVYVYNDCRACMISHQ